MTDRRGTIGDRSTDALREPLDGRLTDADDYGQDYDAQAHALGLPEVGEAVEPPAPPCSCVPVLVHGSRCEHQQVQVEQVVEALDDYHSEMRDDTSWAGIAGVALDTLVCLIDAGRALPSGGDGQ